MNDKLAEVLADAIEKSMGAIDKGVEFTLAQAPDLVYQALVWNFTVSLLKMLAWMALCFFIVKINLIQWRLVKTHWGDEISSHPELVFNAFQLLWGIPIIFLYSLTWLKILIAPKLWLLEYAASLVK